MTLRFNISLFLQTNKAFPISLSLKYTLITIHIHFNGSVLIDGHLLQNYRISTLGEILHANWAF